MRRGRPEVLVLVPLKETIQEWPHIERGRSRPLSSRVPGKDKHRNELILQASWYVGFLTKSRKGRHCSATFHCAVHCVCDQVVAKSKSQTSSSSCSWRVRSSTCSGSRGRSANYNTTLLPRQSDWHYYTSLAVKKTEASQGVVFIASAAASAAKNGGRLRPREYSHKGYLCENFFGRPSPRRCSHHILRIVCQPLTSLLAATFRERKVASNPTWYFQVNPLVAPSSSRVGIIWFGLGGLDWRTSKFELRGRNVQYKKCIRVEELSITGAYVATQKSRCFARFSRATRLPT